MSEISSIIILFASRANFFSYLATGRDFRKEICSKLDQRPPEESSWPSRQICIHSITGHYTWDSHCAMSSSIQVHIVSSSSCCHLARSTDAVLARKSCTDWYSVRELPVRRRATARDHTRRARCRCDEFEKITDYRRWLWTKSHRESVAAD